MPISRLISVSQRLNSMVTARVTKNLFTFAESSTAAYCQDRDNNGRVLGAFFRENPRYGIVGEQLQRREETKCEGNYRFCRYCVVYERNPFTASSTIHNFSSYSAGLAKRPSASSHYFRGWPTIPQIFIKGDFIGGCDILSEMYASGQLEALLREKHLINT